MRVTSKGQVTIPQHIREKWDITQASEIEFIEEKDRVYIVKKAGSPTKNRKFHRLRGVATVGMTTDEIMALTRGEE